ncbi:hypothetical protein [Micromonospora sp. NPDC002575]|uniref:hypothetical protein n=1 Tax=Micromonospora sp. NPDC002575 TaxID=3364222 RepID=UPI003691BB92
MQSSARRESLSVVFRAISAEAEESSPAERELANWTRYNWGVVLLQLPTDAQSFLSLFERTWDSVVDDLDGWCSGFRARPEPVQRELETVFGHLGLLLITLVSLRHSDEYRHPRKSADPNGRNARTGHDWESLCVPLVGDPAVRRALAEQYSPDAWIPGHETSGIELSDSVRSEWNSIDFDTLRFHRHGTTSFILAGYPAGAAHGRRRPLALKCLVYPFLQVPTIVRNTLEYHVKYGLPSRDLRHLVKIWASSVSWILMDYVPGESLAEYLDRRRGNGPRPASAGKPIRRPAAAAGEIDIELLADLGRELFAAMAELEEVGLRHCDLSPSNIIVASGEGESRPSFVLIDLGVNYLYTHALPGIGGPDATYVAPELRAGGTGTSRTDLYSVGQLLVAISGAPGASDGTVPDQFYAETPVMARFIEDLVDGEPTRRLIIFRPDPPPAPLYPQLRRFFDEELAAMAATRRGRAGQQVRIRWLAGLLDLFMPLAGAPSRQWQVWRIRRRQGLYRNPRRSMNIRWLLFASWLSAAAWYVAAAVLITWWLRDLGWDWGNQAIAFLQQATDTPPDRFPYLDDLRQPDYPISDFAQNLPVRMVGLSFLLVGARYYQNLFAGLTPLVAGLRQGWLSLLAVLAELHMRLFAVAAFLLVLPPTLVQGRWWSVLTSVGVLFVFFCNWSCLSFAALALRRAKAAQLSTVPAGRIAGLEAFSHWTPSAAFYAVACGVIGVLIYLGLVKDVYVYASAVTAINIVFSTSSSAAAAVLRTFGRGWGGPSSPPNACGTPLNADCPRLVPGAEPLSRGRHSG